MLGMMTANKNGHDSRSSPSELLPRMIDDAEVDVILRAFLLPLIEALPADESEIIRRAEISGESPETIGHALGLSRQAVAARLRRGRQSLHQLIMIALKSPDIT